MSFFGLNSSGAACDAEALAPLIDGHGRAHSSLRISVTDRCNIRCFYCMPAEVVEFLPRRELLTYEEIQRFVAALAPLGVRKLRITGGEPLVRSDLPALIRQLVVVPGIDGVALTTNGILLADQAEQLKAAGLDRLNISLDAVSEEVFQQITRRRGVDRVLQGIAAAQDAGFERIRLNAVALPQISEPEIVPLARFAVERGLHLRFIEFMPLDAEQNWSDQAMLTGAAVRRTLEAEFGPLQPLERHDRSQPAVDFQFPGGGRVGFINSVSEPFCSTCNRLRLTAEGQVRNCLFSAEEWDVRRLLREGADDASIRQLVRQCVGAKAAAHGIGNAGFHRPERAMYQIGG